eukprot:SAG31_NODE_21399_length_550_cov_1.563193_1_plen_32_part_01
MALAVCSSAPSLDVAVVVLDLVAALLIRLAAM